MHIENNILRYYLRNVYFITGTAYAGKSTMVKMLSEKYGMIACGENFHNEITSKVAELIRLSGENPENPEKVMENYKAGLSLINSQENYDMFVNSGLFTLIRENTTEDTKQEVLEKLAEHFGLVKEL